jgi:hypothetical protein
MVRSFKIRRLRFCTSILFLTSSLLLLCLWVRSYSWQDSLITGLPGVNSAFIESDAGQMRVSIVPIPREWSLASKERPSISGSNRISYSSRSDATVLPWGPMISFPHWYLTLVTAILAGIPWVRRRTPFSTHSQTAANEPRHNRSLENGALRSYANASRLSP